VKEAPERSGIADVPPASARVTPSCSMLMARSNAVSVATASRSWRSTSFLILGDPVKTKTEEALMAALELHVASLDLALHLLKRKVSKEERRQAISMLEANLVSSRHRLHKKQSITTH